MRCRNDQRRQLIPRLLRIVSEEQSLDSEQDDTSVASQDEAGVNDDADSKSIDDDLGDEGDGDGRAAGFDEEGKGEGEGGSKRKSNREKKSSGDDNHSANESVEHTVFVSGLPVKSSEEMCIGCVTSRDAARPFRDAEAIVSLLVIRLGVLFSDANLRGDEWMGDQLEKGFVTLDSLLKYRSIDTSLCLPRLRWMNVWRG